MYIYVYIYNYIYVHMYMYICIDMSMYVCTEENPFCQPTRSDEWLKRD